MRMCFGVFSFSCRTEQDDQIGFEGNISDLWAGIIPLFASCLIVFFERGDSGLEHLMTIQHQHIVAFSMRI